MSMVEEKNVQEVQMIAAPDFVMQKMLFMMAISLAVQMICGVIWGSALSSRLHVLERKQGDVHAMTVMLYRLEDQLSLMQKSLHQGE